MLQAVGETGLPLPVTPGLCGGEIGCFWRVPKRFGQQVYFPHPPLQGAPSPGPFRWPEAGTPCRSACGLEATPGPPATEERQPSPCHGSPSPGWPPPTPGPPQVPSPAPEGGLWAGHLPGAQPRPPPMAAGWVSRPTGLSPRGPQQPPQLRLRWSRTDLGLSRPGCQPPSPVPELHLGPPAPTQPRGLPTNTNNQNSAQAPKATPAPPHTHLVL